MSEELEEPAASAPASAQRAREPEITPRAAAPPGTDRLRGIRLGFLYNHDALHQVAHSTPMIGQLAELYPELEITVLTSTAAQAALIREQLPAALVEKVRFVELRLSGSLDTVDRFVRYIAPFRRVAILRSNLDGPGVDFHVS